MNRLSDQDLALLHTKFVVPIVVGQILRGDETLDETSEYVLNTVIADLQADTALLCVALCAQRLAAHCGHLPVARMLRAEADRVVEEYGAPWLARNRGADIAAGDAMKMLGYLPEDLEAMAHLLDATLGEMQQQKSPAGRLCDLLAVQAHEHMDDAEAQLQRLQVKRGHRARQGELALAQNESVVNIVPFPARRP